MKILMRILFLIFFFNSGQFIINAQQLAFPTAEGFGQHATGGKGGLIYMMMVKVVFEREF